MGGCEIMIHFSNVVACFFVLCFFSFFIRAVTHSDEKPLPPPDDQNETEEEQHYRLPLIK
jgi:hypothetical protein